MKNFQVVLIDDNDIDNFLSSTLLERAGFVSSISSYTSAQKGLEFLLKNKGNPDKLPHLIFLDIRMPGMDGFEFLEQYAQLPKAIRGGIRIVMLSSSVDSVDHDRALSNSDVFSFLMKPLTKEGIISLQERLDKGL